MPGCLASNFVALHHTIRSSFRTKKLVPIINIDTDTRTPRHTYDQGYKLTDTL